METDAPRARLWVPLFLAFAALVQLVFVLGGRTPILGGRLVDTDGYMWLARVAWLVEGGSGWFDPLFTRANAPVGDALNWTRPFDVVLLALAAPLARWLGWREAIWTAGIVASPVLHALACLAIAWAARPLIGRALVPLAAMVALAQPGFLGYSLMGRPDHHALVGLAIALALGGALRVLMGEARALGAFATGFALAFGLWVAVEFLIPAVTIFAVVALWWAIAHPRTAAMQCLRIAVGFALGIVVALIVERGGAAAVAVEYDKLSLPHAWIGALAVLVWASLAALDRDPARFAAARARALALALAGLAAAGGMALVFPRFFLGPLVDFDPWIVENFITATVEMRPLLAADPAVLRDLLIANAGAPVAACWAAWAARRAPRETAFGWWLAAALAAVYFVLAARHARFTMFSGLVAVPGLVGLIAALHERIDARLGEGARAGAARAVATAAVLFALPAIGIVMAHAGGRSAASVGLAAIDAACDVRALAPALTVGPRGKATVVLADPNFGAELLWRTPHAVVATLYNRNLDGNLDLVRSFSALDDATARAIAARRGVGYVLACTLTDGARPQGSLGRRLAEGAPPAWLTPVPLADSGFRLYRVTD